MENWSWIEVVWTLVAVIGAYFSANNIRDGINDLSALKKIDHDDYMLEVKSHRIVARGNIRRDALREFIQLIFLLLGLIALSLENPSRGISLVSIIFQASLIAVSVALTISAIGDHFDRVRLQKLGILIGLRDNAVQSGD